MDTLSGVEVARKKAGTKSGLQSTVALAPFLKWAGGKRWFVAEHSEVFPTNFLRYIEPFLGSGSVFFHLQPERALLGDTNPDLIDAYLGVRNQWKQAYAALCSHKQHHGTQYYYAVRDAQPNSKAERAARLIYLNRTCFNGIFRVNQNGKFNVPKGTRDSVLFDSDDFAATSRLLRRAQIRLADFEVLVDEANRNDFVFADPPYTVTHNLNGFVKYNEKLFSWDDQVRLASALSRARDRGVQIVATNANHKSVRQLYAAHNFVMTEISRFSSISASADSRRQFEELLILNK